jgi:hypothetical protein
LRRGGLRQREERQPLVLGETDSRRRDRDVSPLSSYPKSRGPDNKPRTTLSLGFCPGGGKGAASPGAVKTVEFDLTDASNPMVSQTWLFELPKDKDLKFEKLSGEVKPGGKLTGRATGKKKRDDGTLYDWQIDFDVTLPARAAGGGMGCGS